MDILPMQMQLKGKVNIKYNASQFNPGKFS